MQSPELLIVSALKALTEIALLSLLAQGIVGLLSGSARQHNIVYRLLQTITGPACRGTRLITPAVIHDRYIGLVSFILLFWIWAALIYAKVWVCQTQHLACFPK